MRTISLSGPEGNAFVLLNMARKWAEQLEMDPEPILDDMMGGDYDHLIEVFKREFGDMVTIVK